MNEQCDREREGLPEMSDFQTILKSLEETNEQFRAALELEKATESSTEEDLRILWDIQVVRGRDTPFVKTSGVSSLPFALSPKMVPLATGNLEKDITQKITEPLLIKFMKMIESLKTEKPSEE